MSVRQIDRSRSTGSFETLTGTSVGKRAGIELASLGIGDRVEPQWAPQTGMVHEPEDDRIEAALAGAGGVSGASQDLHVDPDGLGWAIAVERVEPGGTSQIVETKGPPGLSAPGERSSAERAT